MSPFDQGICAFAAGNGFFDNPYMDVPGKETEMRRWVDGMVAGIIAYRERHNQLKSSRLRRSTGHNLRDQCVSRLHQN